MATYYVSKSGSDSTGDGLSPGTAWASIGKAIGSSPAITMSGSGDTLRIGPGAYYECVTLGLSPSASSPLEIVGENGLVEWYGWTNATTPGTSAALEASGQSYVTIRKMRIVGGAGTGGTGSCLNVAGTWSNWTVEDCEVIGGSTSTRPLALCFTNTAATMNLVVRRCDVFATTNSSSYAGVAIRSPLNSTEYDLGAVVESCRFVGGSAGVMMQQVSGGSGSAWATGVRVQQCTFLGVYRGVYVASSPSLTTPFGVYGSAFVHCNFGVYATTSGQIVEDGNYFCTNNARTNVTAGSHSDDTSAPRISLSTGRFTGENPRPFGEPLPGSPLLGAGNYGTPPATDLYGQTRPSPPSIGALERDTFDTPVYIFNVEG